MSAIIGYWHNGPPADAQALLLKCLAASGQTFHQFNLSAGDSQNRRFAASLACAGDGVCISQTDQTLTAALSAAGLPDADGVLIEAGAAGLHLRRDPFGCVPLFVTQCDGVVWFATRLQLLLPLFEAARVSSEALYAYACLSWIPSPLAAVEGIFTVPAGSEIRLTSSQSFVAARRWHEWQLTDNQISDEAAAVAQLRRLLQQAIEAQTADLSSEPVGVFLSGGLDSSVVAALLVRAGVKVRAFALDFGDYGLSELPFAQSVAQHLQIPLVKVDAAPRRIRRALTATAQALDQPFGDGVTVPLCLLGEAASREVRVVFNGEGGDQLFAGWTNKPIIAAGVYEQSHPAGDDFRQAYLRTFHRLHGFEASVFTAQFQAAAAQHDVTKWLADALDDSTSMPLLHRLRRANLMLKGAQNIEPRATNLAFAHGLKVRTPFCWLPLAEWTFSLDGELCLRGPCEKYLLKRAVEEWLPPEIVWREKRGMGAPLTQWCSGPLWRELGRWLSPAALRAEDVWQTDLALRVASGRLGAQFQGRRIGEILWLLLAWQVWRRTVLRAETAEIRPTIYNPFWLPPRWWQWRYNPV
ncbi:MAG TPA: asparagine synthetase B family protein [Blastocatellia bacterium]|nr:asparagine synthetase B family protein [Blastocatellia bacterium]